jgi:DNA (cytosine-5)-methyltransferase 1
METNDPSFSYSVSREGQCLTQVIRIDRNEFVSQLESKEESEAPESEWWRQILWGKVPSFVSGTAHDQKIRVADLFCGSGGFTSGIRLAAKSLGLEIQVQFAVDTDIEATRTYQRNHFPELVSGLSVTDLVDAQIHTRDDSWMFYYPPEIIEPAVTTYVDKVDLLIAGPPCQGHSNLNNHTRREDPRNALYPMAAAVAIGLHAPALVIENVPAVLRDRYQSVDVTKALLSSEGWHSTDAVLLATRIGWPQTRKRHFLAASRTNTMLDLKFIEKGMNSPPRSVKWAIEDLLDQSENHFLDQQSQLSEENLDRIKYLFDNDQYNLPDHIRPLKHRDGHTYPSSYGRMKWAEPSGTITTGFMTPGRGRFIHPLRPRPLTAHEAARIQGFPDTYDFGDPNNPPARALLAKWIGDAVPAPLGFAAGLSVLSTFV